VAAVIPMKVLAEMVEVSLAQDLSNKVAGLLAAEVDSRMKEVVTGLQPGRYFEEGID